MIFVPATHFHIYLLSLSACLAQCLSSVLNVKAVVAAFNQEKALTRALSWLKAATTFTFKTLLRHYAKQ